MTDIDGVETPETKEIDHIQEILDTVIKSAHRLVCGDGFEKLTTKDIHPIHKIVLTEIIKRYLFGVYTGPGPISGIDDGYEDLTEQI